MVLLLIWSNENARLSSSVAGRNIVVQNGEVIPFTKTAYYNEPVVRYVYTGNAFYDLGGIPVHTSGNLFAGDARHN